MGLSREQALDCFESDDLIGIGMEADAVRRRLHPEGVVSYGLEARVSLLEGGADLETMYGKIAGAVEGGATGVVLEGGGGAARGVAWLEEALAGVKKRFPAVWVHGLSASELVALGEAAGLTVGETMVRLQGAGLDSIAGDDAEILDDAVQHERTRRRCSSEDWVRVHRTAHELGLGSTVTMLFGGGETLEHRVNHMEVVRRLQEETGGFTAFTPMAFEPQRAAVPGFEEATAVEYLKTLAIARMYVDNVENVQSDLETQGLKVLQVGLRFGGNDAGSIGLGGGRAGGGSAGGGAAATEEQVRQVIRDAGFKPVQRDTLYRTMFLD